MLESFAALITQAEGSEQLSEFQGPTLGGSAWRGISWLLPAQE